MPLQIRVLGPLEVLADGEPLRVDTRKALAILALLAVEGRPYARDELAVLLWPDSDDESARGALRRTLSVLRTALGDRWLRVDRSAVALPTADVEVDLGRLEALAATGAGPDLAAAAALARGPFLAGFSLRDSPDFDDWRATRAVSVERRVVDVLARLVAAAEAAGDLAAAVEAASRLVELDPLDEPARRRLMALLARSGDRAGAIRLYRATVAVLERELGVAPLEETTELYEAIRDERPAPATTPTPATPATPATAPEGPASALPATPRPTGPLPIVGRDEALAALRTAHAGISADGSLAVVVGEAGIGKSRLVDALATAVSAAGGAVLTARAFPAEGSIAWAPVSDLLRAALAMPDAAARLAMLSPDVRAEVSRLVPLPGATPPESPAAKARLLDAVADALAAFVAGSVPGLVAVEDLQWADDASREALRYLARRLAGRPMLLVLSWRPEDLDPAGAAFAADVERVADAGTVVALERLEPADVEALVRAAGDNGWDADVLASESEGLPLYVVEALAVGPSPAGEAPRGVRALLRERVTRVGETAAQVLAAAAVIGRTFDLDTVRSASGRSEDEVVDGLEELVARAIVRETAGPGAVGLAYDFAHARLRDTAYEAIGLTRRRLLHRRVAEALRAGSARPDATRLAQIAGHEQAAGRDAAAAEAYRDAGLLARRVFANRDALAHLQAALALGHPDVGGIHLAIGEARTAIGDYAGAVTALEAAAAVSDEDALSAIELRLGRVHARRGDVATAASHLDAALDGLADPAERAAALVERGAVALRAGDLRIAAARSGEADVIATALDDPRHRASAARLAGLVAARRGDVDAARAELGRSLALSLATAADDPGPAIAARNALALVEAEAGRRDTAITLLEEALDDARRAGEPHLEAAVENNLADQLHAAGRHDEAIAHLKRAVALFAEVGGRPGELEPEIWKLVSW
ncbi:MAG TPA: AAA family ATPase [Candidatus Limnocylindrales bacterium]|nr:AAA family ATPase [Candidatus Limnocylindrales bacterium]